MWKKEVYTLDSIGIQGSYPIEEIPSIPIDRLPLYSEKTHTLQRHNEKSIQFQNEKAMAHGSYGNLLATIRSIETVSQPVLLKQPRLPEMNLLQEAVLQHLAQLTAEKEGVGWCIPKVYDVFRRQNSVWFSMEYIPGVPVLEWFHTSTTPDLSFYLLLAQISLYLICLETNLGLDHRDLKLDNLLVKQQPSTIQIKVKGSTWTLRSPFTVVLLDFGFACLGSKELRGRPVVNLGDGVLPPMDPCPKEGRDLFQLLISFLRVESFSKRISPDTLKQIDAWLCVGSKSYGPMGRRWSTENWTYLVASQRDFAVPSCCPLAILKNLLVDLKGFLSCSF